MKAYKTKVAHEIDPFTGETAVIVAKVYERGVDELTGNYYIRGQYLKLDTSGGAGNDNLIMPDPPRHLNNSFTRTQVGNYHNNNPTTGTLLPDIYDEIADDMLMNAIVSDGVLGLAAIDLEEYIPSVA